MVGALASTGVLADAHISQEDDPSYLPLGVYVAEYERTGYADFDLIRISLDITNRDSQSMNHPTFMLGGDSTAIPGNSTGFPKAEYSPVSAEYVWNLNVPVSPNDCTVGNQWGDIPVSSTGSVPLCFVVEKSFLPNGLLVGSESGHHRTESGDCYSSGSGDYYQHTHYSTEWPACAMHVVPLQDDSTYCDRYFKYCTRNNIQSSSKLVMAGVSVDEVYVSTPSTKAEADPLGPGTQFMAAATIMAFAVFGSALSMKIRVNPEKKWYIRSGLACIVVVILLQAIFMFCLAEDKCPVSYLGVSSVGWWVFGTAFCALLAPFLLIAGNSRRVDSEPSRSNADKS